MKKQLLLVLTICAGFTLTACSSIIEGTNQSMTITTDPSGALCELHRDGQIIGAVNPTPGMVQIDKSKHDIMVKCSKDGFQDQAQNARSSFEAMSLGNILLGGIIGFGVDLATGATNEYPNSVFIRLMPNVFQTENQREAYFSKERIRINDEADKALSEVEAQCSAANDQRRDSAGDMSENCQKARAAIESERQRKLDELMSGY